MVASTAVTFSTTADTPLVGTPATPATCTDNDSPAPTLAAVRVSATRAGVTPVKRGPAGNQPVTSTISCTLPSLLYSETSPPAPTGTMTRLLATMPGIGFRLEVPGQAMPVGYTVTKVRSVWPTAVTCRATEPTPVAGTPPRPSTFTLTTSPAPTAPAPTPTPSAVVPPGRVSSSRAGVSAA